MMPPGLVAQSFDATSLTEPTDLAAIWLVHAGDDPAYARPDFDDSGWMRFDSTKDLHDLFAQDHPAIVWYRLHVRTSPSQKDLALSEWYLSTAFEVFVNGERIMQCGQVVPYKNYVGGARLLKRISDSQVATGSLLIAVRVRIPRSEWGGPTPGLVPINLSLGKEKTLWEHVWLSVIGRNLLHWIWLFASIAVALVALTLFVAQPREKVYLWMFLLYFANDALRPIEFVELFRNVPVTAQLAVNCGDLIGLIPMMLMYFAFLGIRFGRWIQVLTATAIAGFGVAQVGLVWGDLLPQTWVTACTLPFELLIVIVVPSLFMLQFRRGNREAGILLIPVLLHSLLALQWIANRTLKPGPVISTALLNVIAFANSLRVGPIALVLNDIFGLLILLSLTLIIVLRSTRMSRQQAVIEGELDAAREVQQVILPEQIESIPGFAVEAVYQPAQQVGGDFFQILPDGEGGLLVVVGDVAGKGLPAAMLVSVLVGAIRTAVEFTKDPAELLGHLNERLLGRTKGGFSTTVAARIVAEGMVTIANAGHLSPYVDGREVELPGALPLGVVKGAGYEATTFTLAPGSRLTFYTDGVVEAQNAAGELFGFERGRNISTRPAGAIVEEAKKFGQSDDITVVTVERVVTASITPPTLVIAGVSTASVHPA